MWASGEKASADKVADLLRRSSVVSIEANGRPIAPWRPLELVHWLEDFGPSIRAPLNMAIWIAAANAVSPLAAAVCWIFTTSSGRKRCRSSSFPFFLLGGFDPSAYKGVPVLRHNLKGGSQRQ